MTNDLTAPWHRLFFLLLGVLATAALGQVGSQVSFPHFGAELISKETMAHLWDVVVNLDINLALLAIFGLLFLAGCGLPLPEDIPLTFSGILLAQPQVQAHFPNMAVAVLVIGAGSYLSIISGDLVAYYLGHRFRDSLATWPVLRLALSPKRRAKMNRWFSKYGNGTVFLGRMVAGVRFVTFVSAGMANMRVSRFIMFDSLAALVTVPAWIFLGFMLGTHFDKILVWMSRVSTTTWIVVAAAVIIGVVVRLVMKKKAGPGGKQDSGGTQD